VAGLVFSARSALSYGNAGWTLASNAEGMCSITLWEISVPDALVFHDFESQMASYTLSV